MKNVEGRKRGRYKNQHKETRARMQYDAEELSNDRLSEFERSKSDKKINSDITREWILGYTKDGENPE